MANEPVSRTTFFHHVFPKAAQCIGCKHRKTVTTAAMEEKDTCSVNEENLAMTECPVWNKSPGLRSNG